MCDAVDRPTGWPERGLRERELQAVAHGWYLIGFGLITIGTLLLELGALYVAVKVLFHIPEVPIN